MDIDAAKEHIAEIIRTADNSPTSLMTDGKVDVSAIKSNERDLCDIRALAQAAKEALNV